VCGARAVLDEARDYLSPGVDLPVRALVAWPTARYAALVDNPVLRDPGVQALLTHARLGRACRVVSPEAIVQAVLAADLAASGAVGLVHNVVATQRMAPPAERLTSPGVPPLTTTSQVHAVFGLDNCGNLGHCLT